MNMPNPYQAVADMLRRQGAPGTQPTRPEDRRPEVVVQHRGMTRAERRTRQRKGYNIPAYRNTPLEKENDDV